jgi:hypothetical protein
MQSAKAELRAFLRDAHFPPTEDAEIARWLLAILTPTAATVRPSAGKKSVAPVVPTPRATSPCLIAQILQQSDDHRPDDLRWPICTAAEPDWSMPWQRAVAVVAVATPAASLPALGLDDEEDEDQRLFQQFLQHMDAAGAVETFLVDPDMALYAADFSALQESPSDLIFNDSNLAQLMQMIREDACTQWRVARHDMLAQLLLSYYRTAQCADRQYPVDPRVQEIRTLLFHPQRDLTDLGNFHDRAFAQTLAFPQELATAYFYSRQHPEMLSITY